MEEYINISYLIPLVLSWIVSGWILMVKKDSESTYDYVPIHDTPLYGLFSGLPVLAIIISLIINIFLVGFISTCCYIGIIIVTQLININLLYYLYRAIMGRDGFGTLVPLIAIIPLLIYLYIVQFS
jgi:hypothetical protein